jgi:Arc/MetJ-type ribon-helix-helix transcriptional regulator
MHLELTNPALQKYIADKVSAGEFSSPEAVVEDALNRVIQEEIELTDEEAEAINQAEDEIDRGEFVDWRDLSAKLRARHGIK